MGTLLRIQNVNYINAIGARLLELLVTSPWQYFTQLFNAPQVVGNSLKSLEVSEEKANQRVEEFKKQLKTLTIKLKEAEARAEYAEKTVKKLQKEVDRLEGMTENFFYFDNGYLIVSSGIEVDSLDMLN